MGIVVTLVILLGISALVCGILALAQKGGPAMVPTAVILLALAILIQRIPVG